MSIAASTEPCSSGTQSNAHCLKASCLFIVSKTEQVELSTMHCVVSYPCVAHISHAGSADGAQQPKVAV